MNNVSTNKLLILLVILIILLALVWAVFNGQETGLPIDEDSGSVTSDASYFQEQIIEQGIADIGMPIEGFDNNLLIMAYPGLMPEDFEDVEAFEGVYEVRNDEAEFVRQTEMPVTSAERTISDEGYATLLANLSQRLEMPIETESDVDAIIEAINIGERIETKINQGVSALGATVTPLEVLEDSRCPVDVQCVWAGTVKVRATLESGLGTAEQVFTLDQPITTEAEEVRLIQVFPLAEEGVEIADTDYTFIFQINKR